jgi:aryl sulfotransferase
MTGIFWIASYPKSGNTWFRIFLENLLSQSEKPSDINRLTRSFVAADRRRFDLLSGLEASDLTEDEIDRTKPEIYRSLARMNDGPIFMKIHDALIHPGTGSKMVPPEITDGVVYLIRNPLDVAVSFSHHTHVSKDRIIQLMADLNGGLCVDGQQLHPQLPQRLGSWSHHVTCWTETPGFRVHVVSYEDLKHHPEETFLKAVRFMNLDFSIEQVRRAIEFSSFDILANQEKNIGFGGKHIHCQSFFRKGYPGQWETDLNDKQVDRIMAVHGQTMQRFGYDGQRKKQPHFEKEV